MSHTEFQTWPGHNQLPDSKHKSNQGHNSEQIIRLVIYRAYLRTSLTLSSSQSQYVGIIFASIGKIFEPVYIVNLNESISIQSNFVPDRFISNLEKTNLFSNDQLRFISSDLEINAGNKYIFTNKSKQALLKELNRLSLEKSKEPK
jgi:hypothetical protein